MEKNHSFNSNPNSRDTSPTSRDALLPNDTATNNSNNNSFDDPPPHSYKVKFLCSYGGKIQPRPHDNHLSYVGGDTKILAVDRSIKFSSIMSKLSSLANNATLCFKYQLPGEDLDALISVTNDEDLDHMMVEYDRLSRASPTKPARMRLILFPLNGNNAAPPNSSSPAPNYAPEPKPERQWFVDALNSVQIPHLERPPPPPNPDFLFGFDKVYPKPPDTAPSPTVPDFAAKDAECGPEERKAVIEEPRIHEELQKLQIANNENQQQQHQQQQHQQLQQQQLLLHQLKINEENGGVYGVNGADSYYVQKTPEKVTPLVASNPHVQVHPGPVHQNPVHASFLTNGGYAEPGPVYLIQTASGIYQAVRPVTMTAAPVGPTYYALPRFVPPATTPSPAGSGDVYNTAPLSHSHSASNIGAAGGGGGGGYNSSGASQVGLVNNENGYSQQVGVQHLPERSVGWN